MSHNFNILTVRETRLYLSSFYLSTIYHPSCVLIHIYACTYSCTYIYFYECITGKHNLSTFLWNQNTYWGLCQKYFQPNSLQNTE